MANSNSQSPETSGMQNQQKTLLHILGRETRIVVKNASEVDDEDFFSSQYKTALQIVASIVDNQKDDDDEYDNIENFNNIITFIGDRGSGKTSCMLTFANLLKKPDEIKIKSGDQNEHIENLKKYQFCVLPAIDPSFFVSAYNIIGAFIANIYNQFRKKNNENCHSTRDVDEGVIQNFYSALSKAQRSFGRLYSEKKDDMDDMERLEQLSCSLNLKEDIENLTNAYLCYMNRCSNVRYSKLVLCIDDIDLNTKTAVEIMEWIRKYLIQPNIIILFAVKLDQMFDLKRMNLYAEYKDLLDKEKISDTEIDEMTEKYITKTFPLAHRVHLPDSNLIFNTAYTSYDNKKKYDERTKEKNENNSNDNTSKSNDENKEGKTIRDIVVDEIYDKTRYLFFNYKLETNLIVPDNIRDVLYLMRLLKKMESIPNRSECKDASQKRNRKDLLEKNQRIFKKYFFNNWINKKLGFEFRENIDEILKCPDAVQFNARVLSMMKKISNPILKQDELNKIYESNKEPIFREALQVTQDRNNTYNISMGDAMWIVNWLYNMARSQEETNFLFAVKTIYSMRLFEYYQDMCHSENSVRKNNDKDGNLLQEPNNLKNKRNYHLLLNGQFFNQILNCFYIASMGADGEITLKDKWIDVAKLNEILNDFNSKNNQDENRWKIVEFIMLCASIDSSGNNDNDFYRMNPHARYSLPISKRRECVKFDVCTFFYNITDFESCYKRFEALFKTNEHFVSFINRPRALWREFLGASLYNTWESDNTNIRLRDLCFDNDKIDSEEKNNNYKPKYYICKDTYMIEENTNGENKYYKKNEETKQYNIEENHDENNKDNINLVDKENWHEWLSWCAIRNIEVYQNFIDHMESHREHTSQKTIYETIKAIFENICNYHRHVHGEDKQKYGINFSYAYIIVSLFENIKNDNCKNLFDLSKDGGLFKELPQSKKNRNHTEPYLVSDGVRYFFKNTPRKID